MLFHDPIGNALAEAAFADTAQDDTNFHSNPFPETIKASLVKEFIQGVDIGAWIGSGTI